MHINWLLFEDCTHKNGVAKIFRKPIEMIIANNLNEIDGVIAKINAAQQNGHYLAGFVSYEFGLCFEEKTKEFAKQSNFPLLVFGIFNAPRITNSGAIGQFLRRKNKGKGFRLSQVQYSDDIKSYTKKFNKIKNNIEKGDIYQANLTIQANMDFEGSSIALYEKLRTRQKAKYCAFIDMNDAQILSLSPELFFEKDGQNIETHPMKGTISTDIANAYEKLLHDEKQHAENLMITDLMRNDLAKISHAGSVKVPRLFEIETYQTLLQMISKVKARLLPTKNAADILCSISPAGSITGCPKIRAEELIFETEDAPRDIYCGAIGMIEPNGNAKFNVAIRTPIIKENKLKLGIGSGIVYDSIAKKEYQECLLKSQFLTKAQDDFAIFETLLWTKEIGYQNLEMHLVRLKNAAQHFELRFDEDYIRQMLKKAAENIAWDKARIKISIDKTSDEVAIFEFENDDKDWKIALSKTIIQSNNPWLYYKTTNRKIYDNEWQEYKSQGFDEVIYQNEKGELTEGSRTNIFIDFGDKKLATPPISCGLLNGILRQKLIENGVAYEKILHFDDLNAAQHIYVGNSLRGLKKAIF